MRDFAFAKKKLCSVSSYRCLDLAICADLFTKNLLISWISQQFLKYPAVFWQWYQNYNQSRLKNLSMFEINITKLKTDITLRDKKVSVRYVVT